jgi:hypothetical protein
MRRQGVIRIATFAATDLRDPAPTIGREWLVTNGLGGFASGTAAGFPTRRYHGLLVSALPTPLGRVVMLNHLSEWLRLADGTRYAIGGGAADRLGPESQAAGEAAESAAAPGMSPRQCMSAPADPEGAGNERDGARW